MDKPRVLASIQECDQESRGSPSPITEVRSATTSCRRPSERSASSDASAELSTREPPEASDMDKRSDQSFDITPEGPNITNHRREDLQSGYTFHQFPKLPRELQLMIWEHTWPESRVIEVAICKDETAEEYIDVAILRFAGSLSSLLEEDFGTRVVEEKPLETSAPPVALQVCQESRTHTLIQYQIIAHTRSRQGSFYFNPRRDLLWLSFDSTNEHLQDLQHCYSEQLNAIKTLLVEEIEWNDYTPAGYTSKYLKYFNGLKSILVLFSNNDEDTDENTVDEDNGEESGGDDSEDNNKSGNQEPESEARELLVRANELRAEYTEFLKVHKETAKTMRCMDRSGIFY